MARLTLRLPESLYARLVERAKLEGVSMNQYVVYALSRATVADEIATQKDAFEKLRQRYPADEAEKALREVLSARD